MKAYGTLQGDFESQSGSEATKLTYSASNFYVLYMSSLFAVHNESTGECCNPIFVEIRAFVRKFRFEIKGWHKVTISLHMPALRISYDVSSLIGRKACSAL